jgi:transglutaminase-like putative cysteine protease
MVAAALLTAALAGEPGWTSAESKDVEIGTAAKRLADAILDPDVAKLPLPLSSDAEHARTIDPVMTEGAAIWFHEALPAPPLTVLGGRVFSYNDVTYDPLAAPVLKIRPIDDAQAVPFLVRVSVSPDGNVPPSAALTLAIPAPPVFDPRINQIEGWVGSKAAEVSIDHSPEDARFYLRAPLTRDDFESARETGDDLSVIFVGELTLGPYKKVSANRFMDIGDAPPEASLARLANLEINRDFETTAERDRLVHIGGNVSPKSSSSYEKVVAANSWVSSHLVYRKSPATRSAVEAVDDRSGDCDEHSILMVALLRSMGIPARRATGLLYNFNTVSAHAWVEVGLPDRKRVSRWFIVDPTLAGTTPLESEKTTFVQFKDRLLLYPLKPSTHLEGMTGRRTTDVLFNWRKPVAGQFSNPNQLDALVDAVTSSIDRRITGSIQSLVDEGLRLRRESASIVGSPYLIVDRAVTSEGSLRIQLRLENEERLVFDLRAEGSAEIDDKSIRQLRAVYTDLQSTFFAGEAAHHNLELLYLRDRHSDKLQTVSLRVGRFLLEHQLARILRGLSRAGFLTEAETAGLLTVATTSGGKNLYLLQDLARTVPDS